MISLPRWENRLYRRIWRVEFDESSELLTVEFADGSKVTFDPVPLVPSDLVQIDWWRVASNPIEVVIPHATGWFEVPWDVIRRHTDEEYADYWEAAWLRIEADHAANHRSIREETSGAEKR